MKIVRRIGSVLGGLKSAKTTRVLCLFGLATMLFSPANAQIMGSGDPYGASQPTNSPYGSAGYSNYGSSGGYGSTSGYNSGSASSGNGSQSGSGSSYNPGGGNFQNYGNGSAFTPVTLPPNLDSSLGIQRPLEPFTGYQLPGAIPPPIYARPTNKPGEFELFERPPPEPGEFEKIVAKTVGRTLARYGDTLILNGSRGFVTPSTATVPPDYLLNAGDELRIGITGSVEADLSLVIDSEGRIFIPRIGTVNLAGVRYGDLAAAIKRRINDQYKHVNVSAVIAHLHGLTVYVTGHAVNPGAYTVSSLSTMVNAVLAAGGPSSGGSYRVIELKRNGRLVSKLDLYDLLLKGDTSHDAVLQNEDVLDIQPTGPEVAIVGSVNEEAIYEAKAGESLSDMITLAGGFNSLADRSRIVISSLADLDLTGSRQLTSEQATTTPATGGDIVRVLSLANVARPEERQAILATIDGEVDHPGRYYLPPGSTMADLLRVAGGETAGAFVYGSEFDRTSTRLQQKKNYDRVIDDLRLAAETDSLTQQSSLATSTDRQARSASVSQGLLALVDQLKSQEPTGRIVLPVVYSAPTLPTGLKLENLDHLYIPPVPKVVGVYGAAYSPGSYLYTPGQRLEDYLRQAGGARRKIAAEAEIFIVRANGSVVSREDKHGILHEFAQPGDVIFVPVRTSPSLFDRLLAVSQLVFQYGVGIGALAISIHDLT